MPHVEGLVAVEVSLAGKVPERDKETHELHHRGPVEAHDDAWTRGSVGSQTSLVPLPDVFHEVYVEGEGGGMRKPGICESLIILVNVLGLSQACEASGATELEGPFLSGAWLTDISKPGNTSRTTGSLPM